MPPSRQYPPGQKDSTELSNIEQTANATQIYPRAAFQHFERLRGNMDIQKILAELREQRDQVAAVIEALEKISFQQTPRRGRPPKWLTVNRISAMKNGANGSVNGSFSSVPSGKAARDSTFAATNAANGRA